MSVKGVVKNLTDYGAFVDLGGVDGLLHITDMAWKRIKHPSEIVEVGQEIDVKILKFDRERNRVSLGLKQLGEDPWVEITNRYPEGARVNAKVTNLTDYGCFAEIEEGVEGLVHVSEMDWTNKNVHPSKIVQLGDEVEVMVLDIDEDRRRISLGIKQCTQNPWDAFASDHAKGDRISGTIKSITDFGIFIGLDGAIDGLVHLSDISWNETGEEAVRNYKNGDEIETVILSIDPERERISLGIKQCTQNQWDAFASDHAKGDRISGTIKSITDFGIFIGLDGAIDGLVHLSDISWNETGEEAVRNYKKGDEIETVILSIDPERERISLGIKQMEEDAFTLYVSDNDRGTIVTGKAVEVDAKGVLIKLSDEVSGYLKVGDISVDRIEDARSVINVGDAVEAKITNVDRKNRTLGLSIKAKDIDDEKDAVETLKQQDEAASPGTIGDLIKAKMDSQ